MTVQLSQPDFLPLTRIIQNLPDFANVRDRTDLVAEALANVPQVNSILARLDLDGSPLVASMEVVRFLNSSYINAASQNCRLFRLITVVSSSWRR